MKSHDYSRIIVVPYSSKWPDEFKAIKSEIEAALGDLMIGIEHVGSTSVAGLSAKPIIDLDVIIQDYSVFDKVVSKLKNIGYNYQGDLGIKDREAFFMMESRICKRIIYMFALKIHVNCIGI